MRVRGRWAFAAVATAGARRDRERAWRRRRGTRPQAGEGADHHRLGVRQHRAPWRRSTLRRLAAAQLRVAKVNAKGGVGGRKLRDPDVRYAGEQPCNCEGVRVCVCSDEKAERHLHDLRRRLRRAGRQGGDRPRCPCNRAMHRHRPDGTEAVRPEGRPGVQLRQRRAGRRVGDGPVRAGAGAGRRRHSRPTRSSSTSRTSFRRSRSRFKQLGGKIVAKETYQSLGGNNVQNAVSRLNNVKADVIVTSTAARSALCRRSSTGLRTLGNNTPILNSWAGDGTYWLPTNPEGDELLVRHRSRRPSATTRARRSTRWRRRSRREPAASSQARAGDRRRSSRRSSARDGSTEGIAAREGDGEVQERADDLGQRQLLARRCTRCSAAGTASSGSRTTCRRSSARSSPGRSEDLRRRLADERTPDETTRRPGTHSGPPPCRGHSRACTPSATSRSSCGRARGRRADRPERGGQVDARERAQRASTARRAARSSSKGRDVTRWSPQPARAAGLRQHVPAQPLPSARCPCARTSRLRRSASGAAAREARQAGRSCSRRSGSPRMRTLASRHARAGRRAATRRRTRARDQSRASSCSTSRRPGCPRPRCPSFADAVAAAVRDDHDAGVLLIDHNMALIMEICDRIYVLDQGRGARRRDAARRFAPISTSPPPTWARAPCTRTNDDERPRSPSRLRGSAWCRDGGARSLLRGRPGRDRRADRARTGRASRRRCTPSWVRSVPAAGDVRVNGSHSGRPSGPEAVARRGVALVPEGQAHLRRADGRGEPRARAGRPAQARRRRRRHRDGSTTSSRRRGSTGAERPGRSRAVNSSSSRSRGRWSRIQSVLLLDEPSLGLAPRVVDLGLRGARRDPRTRPRDSARRAARTTDGRVRRPVACLVEGASCV